MKFMRTVFLTLVAGLLTLLVLFLLNVGVHRLLGPSDAQKQALAKLAEVNSRPAKGDNAFALLWLMRYDVADTQIETIAADDVRRAQAMIAEGKDLNALIPVDRPLLPEPSGNEPALCETGDDGCLARVQANPEATRALLARFPRSLQRARTLEAKDSYRNELPLAIGTTIPEPGQAQRLRLSDLALAWQDGQRAEALAGTCRNIASWRRLRYGNNSLIVSMLGIAYMDSGIRLFGDMLSELPPDQALPADCKTAFAPIAVEDVSICAEMAGESLLSADTLSRVGGAEDSGSDSFGKRLLSDALMPLLFDRQQTLAWSAEEISDNYCGDEAKQQALQDQLIDHSHASPPWLECAANMVGCVLNDIAMPAFVDYPTRLLDSAAHLRLGATLIWLRESGTDPATIASRFAERPASLRSGERASDLADDKRSISVDNLYQQRVKRFSLPLSAPTEIEP